MPLSARLVATAILAATATLAPRVEAAEPTRLSILAAGTLAVPFKQLDELFQQKYPSVTVEPQFGGSVKMARQITELHQPADLIAVADFSVIPKYLFGANGQDGYASWYAGFARNAITFVYTDKSKFAGEINAQNWYQVLARPGVEIGRSDPDTDPSGYQTVQMLSLAEKHYGVPGLAAKILANAPRTNMRDTETSLISALQLGQIDYLAIYRSDALQHHFKFLDLPPAINLSDPRFSSSYAEGVARTRNGELAGKPIVYAVTITTNAEHRDWAEKYIALLLGPEGQAVMQKNGFGRVDRAYAVNREKMPAALQALAEPWPGS
ncbi:MAG TPA: extracellular solute-binding protein [Stellaceae bacterium]|nr:extracellular solute-binding protein [Stellaceae bacterium]